MIAGGLIESRCMTVIISSNSSVIFTIIVSITIFIITITSRIGARKCCLLGGFILVSGTFLSSIATSLSFLLFTNGILFGSGMGICYSAPIACAARHIPHRKGKLKQDLSMWSMEAFLVSI
jgi:MFS family permease